MKCVPKPLPATRAVRRGFLAALAVSLLAFIAADVYAQAGGSGYTIMRVLDGTTIVNPGDTANSAIRVNVVAGSASGVSHVDDAAFTVATDDIVPMGAMFDDTTPDSVNEGDAGVPRMSANRVLYGTIRDAAGNERGANVNASNQLEVSAAVGSIAAGDNNIGNVDIASAIPAGTNNIGDVDVLTFPSVASANNGGAQVSVTTTSGTVLASFATRKGCAIVASPNNTDVVHLKLGATATTANGKLWPGQPWNCGPVTYTGVIDARSAAGTQEVTVWEW
jgi:hypothetical protein